MRQYSEGKEITQYFWTLKRHPVKDNSLISAHALEPVKYKVSQSAGGIVLQDSMQSLYIIQG